MEKIQQEVSRILIRPPRNIVRARGLSQILYPKISAIFIRYRIKGKGYILGLPYKSYKSCFAKVLNTYIGVLAISFEIPFSHLNGIGGADLYFACYSVLIELPGH